jgi:hypothetical protein
LLAQPKSGVGGAANVSIFARHRSHRGDSFELGGAFAEDYGSANSRMAGCHAFLLAPTPPELLFDAGMCVGIVNGINFTDLGVCPPAGATSEQAVRVVVKYIDDRPAKLNENFKTLALEALRVAWPCKN